MEMIHKEKKFLASTIEILALYVDLNERKVAEFEEEKGESETIAGFILEIFGKFPKKNQTIQFKNYSFKIELMDKKRIKQVKVTIARGE